MVDGKKYSLLFVCMGNICRSPTAEAIFRHLLAQSPIADKVSIDSAGTTGYHAGERPDPRAIKAAEGCGYSMKGIIARQIQPEDLDEFDQILVMDRDNLRNTKKMFHLANKPEAIIHKKVQLFLDWATEHTDKEVPDPYYGGEQGFHYVIELIEDASRGLIRELEEKLV